MIPTFIKNEFMVLCAEEEKGGVIYININLILHSLLV